MSVLYDEIPDDMKDEINWVVWRFVERNGKQTKVPVDAITGNNARSNDPNTWASFKQAVEYYEAHPNIDGIGFMLGDKYTGIDIDHVLGPNSSVSNKLMLMVNEAGTYTEISPSGTGLHLIYKADKPGTRSKKDNFEMYQSGRYFTITGNRFGDAPKEVSDDQSKVDDFYNEFLDDGTQQTKSAIDKIIDDTIHTTDRRQVTRNGYRDSYCTKRFARIPRGIFTCDWCLMLASQGFIYHTDATAFAPGHSFCDCAIVADYKDTTYIEGYDVDEYKDYYKKNLKSKYANDAYYQKRNKRRGTSNAPGGGAVMTEDEYLKSIDAHDNKS